MEDRVASQIAAIEEEAARGRDVEARLVGAEQTYRTFLVGRDLAQGVEVHLPEDQVPTFTEWQKGEENPAVSLVEQAKNGLRIAAVFGHAVSQALRSLRHQVDGFDEWWRSGGRALRDDPVASMFYALRSTVVHEGYVGLVQTRASGGPQEDGTWWLQVQLFLAGATVRDLPEQFREMPVGLLLQLYGERLRETLDSAWGSFLPGVTPHASARPLGVAREPLEPPTD